MKAIIVLIILGIILAGGFLAAFIWAVRSGQYDDDYTPSVRMLFENKRETTQDGLESGESDERKPSQDMKDEQLNQ